MSTRRVVELSEVYSVLKQLALPCNTPVTPRDIVIRRVSRHVTDGGRRALAAALFLTREPVDHLANLPDDEFTYTLFESPTFDKYQAEADELLEDAPVNAAGTGAIAGLIGDPPVKRKRRT